MSRTVFRVCLVLMLVLGLLIPAASAAAGGPKGKVEICHIPPGDPGNAHTITVATPAVKAHLAHGDTLGRCPVERPGEGQAPVGDRDPVARAGDDRCVVYGGAVELDGTASSDPDGDPLVFDWDVLLRPTGSALTDAGLSPDDDDDDPTFVPDRLGLYRFELEVRDPDGRTDTDTVDVTVRMGVTLGALAYEVDEGETTPVLIRLNTDAPQAVTVSLGIDPTEAVVVPESNDGPGDAITSVVIAAGDDDVVVYLLGVEDADALDEQTTLTVTVGSGGCTGTDSAPVEVDDDEVLSSAAPRTVPLLRLPLGFRVG